MHDYPKFPLRREDKVWIELICALATAAEAGARAGMRAVRHRLRRRIGGTLRPGTRTPLWNELIRQARPFLHRRGSKAELARFLGVPRQRLQDCLKARTACLDAERTLLLLAWIAAHRRGGPLLR